MAAVSLDSDDQKILPPVNTNRSPIRLESSTVEHHQNSIADALGGGCTRWRRPGVPKATDVITDGGIGIADPNSLRNRALC